MKARLAPFSHKAQVSEIWLGANLALSAEVTTVSLSKLHMRWARAGVEELSSGLSSIAKPLLSRLAVWSR